jgi:phage-related tail fiber protein
MTWTKKIRIEQIETGSLSGSYFVQGGNSFGTTATLGTNDNQSLAFETNGTTKMFISSSGNVGISTTNPTASLHISGSTTQNIFRAGNSTNPRLLDITGSNVNQIGGNFLVNNSLTQINSSANIGLQVSPEAWVHIYTDPENIKFLRIDAVQNAVNPPTYSPDGGRTVTAVWGNIDDNNVLGTPDFWMEIELNGNGNIVLIPCYTPGT